MGTLGGKGLSLQSQFCCFALRIEIKCEAAPNSILSQKTFSTIIKGIGHLFSHIFDFFYIHKMKPYMCVETFT